MSVHHSVISQASRHGPTCDRLVRLIALSTLSRHRAERMCLHIFEVTVIPKVPAPPQAESFTDRAEFFPDRIIPAPLQLVLSVLLVDEIGHDVDREPVLML